MAYNKIALFLAAALAATNVAAVNSDEIQEFNVILSDVMGHLTDYISYAENDPNFTLPDHVLDLYMAMTTATDDSYTTMYNEINFAQVTTAMTRLPWYSSRILPKISPYLEAQQNQAVVESDVSEAASSASSSAASEANSAASSVSSASSASVSSASSEAVASISSSVSSSVSSVSSESSASRSSVSSESSVSSSLSSSASSASSAASSSASSLASDVDTSAASAAASASSSIMSEASSKSSSASVAATSVASSASSKSKNNAVAAQVGMGALFAGAAALLL
ncbi:Cell wall protein TIR3 [Nakaseomyces bracarensis]|uniref:Cell wall protein TIR3 n=1 Tax=Nakaseomyces bracarensis TaxID=273131 RepID=A0ABR4NST5_9SACH